ncbi:MAG: hypothetical protein WD688_09745 [Candidatus Binatia bacterium]
MRILIYGFAPYKQFRDNITEKIIKALPSQPGLKKMVFPARFHKGQFIEALKKHRLDGIIGLGQCTRRKIEVESRAVNRKRTRQTDPGKPIRHNGPRFLPTTLEIKLRRQVGSSNNAGDYVCNYSMYVILDNISRKALEVRFGFIHIPHDCNLCKATEIVAAAIKQVSLDRKGILRHNVSGGAPVGASPSWPRSGSK